MYHAYELIGAGVVASIQLLDKVESFYAGLDEGNGAYSATISEVMTMLHSKEWERLKKLKVWSSSLSAVWCIMIIVCVRVVMRI